MKNLLKVLLAGLISVLILAYFAAPAKFILIGIYGLAVLYQAKIDGLLFDVKKYLTGLVAGIMILLIWQVIIYTAGWGIWLGTLPVNWLDLFLWVLVSSLIWLWLKDASFGGDAGWKNRLIKSLLAGFWLMFFGAIGWGSFISLILLWFWIFGIGERKRVGWVWGVLLGYYFWSVISNFHIINDELPTDVIGPAWCWVVYWVWIIWQFEYSRLFKETYD